jgi:DNA-binding MarR family transcriptional regulator
MTRLVDRLERAGYLERVACDADGRGMYAALTDAGDALLAEARPTHLEGVRRRFLDHFEGSELADMGAFWDRLLGAQDLTRPD